MDTVRNLKIMHIIPELGAGGAEIMCEQLMEELHNRGHSILLVSLYDTHNTSTKRIEEQGIYIKYLRKRKGFDISCISKLRKAIMSFNPDVIHTHLYSLKYALLANYFARKPIIHTIHNEADKEVSRIDRLLCGQSFKNHRAVPVSISDEIQKTVIREYNLKPSESPIIINGINLKIMKAKSGYKINDSASIIHVARFEEQKNHECILEAVKKINELHFNITCLGHGPLFDEIKRKAETLGVESHFSFKGIVDNVKEYLTKADIFILPSKWEGVPISIIEAMASGLPIIASDVGGVKDLLTNNESGLLITPDPDSLASAIKRLMESEDLRRKLGQNAYLRSNLFSVEYMADKYEKLYLRGE